MKNSHDLFIYLLGIVAAIGIIASSYFAMESRDQKSAIVILNNEKATLLKQTAKDKAQMASANRTITELKADFEDLKEDLEDLADDYRDEKNKNNDFEDQIRGLAGTLGDLDKLAKIDEELLAKYSKVYFLNENFTPDKLKQIDDRYILEGKKDQYFNASAIEHLEDMLKAAAKDKIDLKIVSAYRSFDEQSDLKGQYTQVYGDGANTFSADQGYSEHQLGTTLDLTTPDVGGTYNSFAETEAYEWMLDNAHKYGFILSYPEENTFYIFEPWHWRFVGTELARDLNRNDETFYSMEQRKINEYLLGLFD